VTLTREQLIRLARLGAEKRLGELDAERKAIKALLGGPSGRRATGGTKNTKKKRATASPRKRRGWNAAQRKAAAARMKAYWAKRKASKRP
jgi:hypothetical protein